MERWTLTELVAEVARRIAELPAPKNGQVRAVPDERTIRYYGTLGLLDRPAEMRGRTAFYAARHAAQVIAIKRLQNMGRSLAEIQTLWPDLDDATLAQMSGVALPKAAPPKPARAAFWKGPPLPGLPGARAAAHESPAGAPMPASMQAPAHSQAAPVPATHTHATPAQATPSTLAAAPMHASAPAHATPAHTPAHAKAHGHAQADADAAAPHASASHATPAHAKAHGHAQVHADAAAPEPAHAPHTPATSAHATHAHAHVLADATAPSAPIELRIELAPNVSIVLSAESISLSPADVRAIRAAAAPLVAELASRRLAPHAGGEP